MRDKETSAFIVIRTDEKYLRRTHPTTLKGVIRRLSTAYSLPRTLHSRQINGHIHSTNAFPNNAKAMAVRMSTSLLCVYTLSHTRHICFTVKCKTQLEQDSRDTPQPRRRLDMREQASQRLLYRNVAILYRVTPPAHWLRRPSYVSGHNRIGVLTPRKSCRVAPV